MDVLQSLDAGLFRFINLKLANPWFDWLMPALSWHWLFPPAVAALALGMIWKAGRRGRLCVLLIVIVVALGDGLVVNTLKKVTARPRPFIAHEDARVIIGRGGSYSMPSGHTANWFAAAMVAFIFYRRSGRFMFPVAAIVGFSRVYNGVHYPSDVLAGAILGAGYGALAVWLADGAWRKIGSRWFPIWWQTMPSVFNPDAAVPPPADPPAQPTMDAHWLRLGFILIATLCVARIGYLAAGRIELSEDEAYQWLWSKHLDLAYFSKPPGIAVAQRFGCALWGDSEFGVRFLSPCIAALLGVLLLRFLAREVSAVAGVLFVLAVTATPLLAVGSTLMTIDALSVLFWTASMLAGWRAVRDGATRAWCWAGFWAGCGFLCKATALFQLVSFALVLVASKSTLATLRKPGPWLAAGLVALSSVPVLVWNARHDWATAHHLQSRAGLEGAWKPTLNFLQDFLVAEFLLLNPVFFILVVGALVASIRAFLLTRPKRDASEGGVSLRLYLFCMGAPLFIGYLVWTLRARVQPNWIAPAVIPLMALALIHWLDRWRVGNRAVRPWFAAGIAFGLVATVFLHETGLAAKVAGVAVPPKLDPLVRVRGWRALSVAIDAERMKLSAEGKPVFLIGSHYGITSLLNFYVPGARPLAAQGDLQAFYPTSEHAENQFHFWTGYRRKPAGASAIYVLPLKRDSAPQAPPERILREFGSVTHLGMVHSEHKGVIIHTAQLFVCRDLKP